MSTYNAPGSMVEPLMPEAMAWLDKIRSSRATVKDMAALETWRALSPAHDAAFRDIVELRRRARDLAASRPHLVPKAFPKSSALVARRTFIVGAGAAAAASAAGAVIFPPLGLWPSLNDLMADHRTVPGQQFAFAPAPGVNVEMNSRTSVAVAGKNSIRLVDGEVFIAMGRMQEAKFSVTAGPVTVAGNEASFNVRAVNGTVCVSCASGKAEVSTPAQAVSLNHGDQVELSPEGKFQARPADMVSALAWRRGLIIFDGAPLSEVIAQVNRYISGRILLANASLGSKPVAGVFRISRIDFAVTQIQQTVGAHATHLPGGLVILT